MEKMMIKPTKEFNAVVPGSAYPQTFTPDDEFAPDSVAARAALDLGCLSYEDADAVAAAHGLELSGGTKSVGGAPENKADGVAPEKDTASGDAGQGASQTSKAQPKAKGTAQK